MTTMHRRGHTLLETTIATTVAAVLVLLTALGTVATLDRLEDVDPTRAGEHAELLDQNLDVPVCTVD